MMHDNGKEFTGQEFQGLLYNLGIKPSGTTVKNPQLNAICEQIHKIIATILKMTIKASPPKNVGRVNNLVEDALAAEMHSLCVAFSTTLKATPGGLAFSFNMLLNVILITDQKAIQKHREQLVNKALLKSNKKRINYVYCVGQKILKYNDSIAGKLESKTTGPFEILHVHTNGRVTIILCPGISDRINFQRTIPYRKPT